MEKLNAEQILDIVSKHYRESDFAYGEWLEFNENFKTPLEGNSLGEKERFVLNELGLGEIKEADSYGGEDCGAEWYKVWYFKDHDLYIRIDGYYQSYNGAEFNDGYGREVKKTEKVITVFE